MYSSNTNSSTINNTNNININDNSINNQSYLYIWLMDNQLYYHKTFELQDKIIGKIVNGNDKYIIELTPVFTHSKYNANTSISYCDVKFLKKNGSDIQYMDFYMYQERSLSNCLNEYRKFVNNSELDLSFTFKINSQFPNYNQILNNFDNVIKYINYDNDNYIIKIQADTPINTCYYYCFVRFYLESISLLRPYNLQRYTISEFIKYYFYGSDTIMGSLYKTFIKPLTRNFNKLNTLEANITLPLLNKNNVNISSEHLKIDNNKLELESTYSDFHSTIVNKLSDYIFNKNNINELYLELDNTVSYTDNRANIYCNPFNLLYYHLCVINVYILDNKKDELSNKFNTFKYNLISTLDKFNVDMFTIDEGLEENVNEECDENRNNNINLLNLSMVKYCFKYFNMDNILEDCNNSYDCEMEVCSNISSFIRNLKQFILTVKKLKLIRIK